jgi:very-short-patch-repair endonuclease
VASLQKGFVTREQLLAAGLGRGAIAHRLTNGRLYQRYPSVYLVGRDSLEPFGEEMGAVLYYRGHAVLSHRTAAYMWDLLDVRSDELSLTIVGMDRHPRPGLRLHRVGSLDRDDLRVRDGLPLTSPARTLVDLAHESSGAELEEALGAALGRRLAHPDEVCAELERIPRRPGAARLRQLLKFEEDTGFARSKTERRLRHLLRLADLPLPMINVRLHGFLVDFLWAEARLIVEVDGYEVHKNRAAFERDRRRDQILMAAGYRVIRVTWRQLRDEPMAVIARLAQALVAGG